MHVNTCRRGLLVAWGLGLASVASAQSRAPLLSTIDARVGAAPALVRVAGRDHLVYELHITNFGRSDVALDRVAVEDAAARTRIAEVSDAALLSRLGRPGAPANLPDKRIVAPGMRAVVYWWIPLDAQQPLPARVRHVIRGEAVTPQGRRPLLVSGAEADVQRDRLRVLRPPLRGGPWVALYDPLLMGGHRTAIYAIDGQARIPARFAVDFVRLHNDGTHADGDRNQIANWHGYGAEVLAVADATVIEARDDLPESPSIDGSRRRIPLENASGNFVTLDLGGGRFAFYEHLRHGSIRVQAGDRVKAGDVLGQLGNSGSSSSGPHLHFHIADASNELAGEGTPFVLAQFETIGAFADINAFTTAARWAPAPPEAAGSRRGELPAPNSVVIFPDSDTTSLAQSGGSMTLSGKTLTLTYNSGLIVRGTYSADSVRWEALAGPAKGSTGSERTYVQALSPTTWFVSWVEASGTTVSQILDLDARKVWAFVTFAAGNARQATLDHGSITIERES